MKILILNSVFISAILIGLYLCFSGCKEEDNQPQYVYIKTGPIIFNPLITYGSMTDQDANIYKTVTIGTQTWMAENLRTTKYSDGTPIPLVTSWDNWKNYNAPAFCWYDNNPDTCKSIYGALYNWHAVNTGKLAPIGWHVPTDAEWQILIDFLGGVVSAGGKMKETDTTHWAYYPNSIATNVSGFTLLPGGMRWCPFGINDYNSIHYYAYLWSSSKNDLDDDEANAVIFQNWSYEGGGWYFLKGAGYSVRCLKDE